jgi:tetratricopeptide (TPR) repeat protein
LAQPHAVLGNNKYFHEWAFAEGEAEFKKAFELDPSDATAHQWYAQDISFIGGREEEALAEINRAHQLDPLSPIISLIVCEVYIHSRQYDRAIEICKKVADDNPTFAEVHNGLAQAYWGKRFSSRVSAFQLVNGVAMLVLQIEPCQGKSDIGRRQGFCA